MNLLYTVDRNRTLEENQMINLIKYSDVKPSELQVHIDSLFPDGVTSHGEYYMLNAKTPAIGINAIIELIFEYVRRSYFPSCPSRFQSVFAFENIAQAFIFQNKYGKPDSLIWKVESDITFKADMRLLNLHDSLLTLSYNAHRYWNGISIDNNPIWEYLLVPPVKVIHRIY
jgi:hypothetical protein